MDPGGCGQGDEAAGGRLYTVENGKVDTKTLQGWETWRAAACQRCHEDKAAEWRSGPLAGRVAQVALAQRFQDHGLKGRADKGMPGFGDDQKVVDNLDNLYAYLKGRSDGAIPPGKLTAIGS